MKQKTLLKTMLLLCALIVGYGSAWGQVTLWSEDFSSYSADDVPSGGTYSYACTNGTYTQKGSTKTAYTKIWNENSAGGTAPELLVARTTGGSFTATIPLDNIEGTLTLTYYQNAQKLKVSSTTAGVSGGQELKPSAAGQQTTTFTGITKDMTSITIVFETTTANNVRLDNIVLTGNKASNIAAPTINVAGGFYTTAQEVTITTNETGGTTYYTLDGTSPTNESTQYTGAISISTNTTLKAVTYKGNEHSAVVSATYSFVEDGVFDFVTMGGVGYDYGSGVSPTSDGSFYVEEEKTWTAGNVTMVTAGKYRWWSDYTLRLYSNTPVSSATFSVPDGYVITKIVSTGGKFVSKDKGNLEDYIWTGVSQSVKLSIGSSTVNFSSFTITYVPAVPVTLAASGYASYCSPQPLDLPSAEDYAAYKVTEVNKDAPTVLFEKITGPVPAGTPFILYGEGMGGTTVNLPVATGETTEVTGNALIGTLVPTPITTETGEFTNFGLSGGQFVKMNAGTIPANKAYLPVPTSFVTSSAPALTIVFGDDETTGIGTTLNDSVNDNVIYDLSGRRVAQPTKGIYIVNGKKVVIK